VCGGGGKGWVVVAQMLIKLAWSYLMELHEKYQKNAQRPEESIAVLITVIVQTHRIQ
jgi:hypothetical protein